jgi:hypothetical protein
VGGVGWVLLKPHPIEEGQLDCVPVPVELPLDDLVKGDFTKAISSFVVY